MPGFPLASLAVLALVTGLILAPWLRSLLRLRQHSARLRTQDAPIHDRIEDAAASEAETLTLRGHLEAKAPNRGWTGAPLALLALDAGKHAGDTTLAVNPKAAGLHLRLGPTRVQLVGPVRIAAASHQLHPRRPRRRLPKALARQVEALLMAGELEGEWSALSARSWLRLHGITQGAQVRVRGRLEAPAADPAGAAQATADTRYRLVPADADDTRKARLQLIAEAPPRLHWLWRTWAARSAVISALVLVALPWGLGRGAGRLIDEANDTLRDCDAKGNACAAWAQRLLHVQAIFPGWRGQARQGRLRAVDWAVNGVQVCSHHDDPRSSALLPGLVHLARRTLPSLADVEGFDEVRQALESTLHAHGRDRVVVALERHLPQGGDVAERVRAHLYLGDLQGAAEVWRQPGTHAEDRWHEPTLSRGNVLCLDGDYPSALRAFAADMQQMPSQLRQTYGDELVFRYGECAVRARRLQLAAKLAARLSQMEYGKRAASLLQLRIALTRQDATSAQHWARQMTASHCARDPLAAWVLGQHALASGHALPCLGHPVLSFDTPESLYNAIFRPILDLKRQEQLITLLEESTVAAGTPEMTQTLGRLLFALAVQRARRWDPKAAAAFAQAGLRLPDDKRKLQRVARTFDFMHGDWQVESPEVSIELQQLARAYRGDGEAARQVAKTIPNFSLRVPTASNFEVEHHLAALHHAPNLPKSHKIEVLRRQTLEAPWLTLFYRLTHLIVHGKHWGLDVRPYKRQMARLRQMFDVQPNPYLLAGPKGTAKL